MNLYCYASKETINVGSWRFLRLTARAADYFVQSPRDIRKFIINLPSLMALAAGIAVVDGDATWQEARAQSITGIDARVIAMNIPGASAIAQIGMFLN
jgi:hypothetical protein